MSWVKRSGGDSLPRIEEESCERNRCGARFNRDSACPTTGAV
jgi:hypothetical protein